MLKVRTFYFKNHGFQFHKSFFREKRVIFAEGDLEDIFDFSPYSGESQVQKIYDPNASRNNLKQVVETDIETTGDYGFFEGFDEVLHLQTQVAKSAQYENSENQYRDSWSSEKRIQLDNNHANNESNDVLAQRNVSAYTKNYHSNIEQGLKNQLDIKIPDERKRNHFAGLLAEDGLSHSQLKLKWLKDGGGILNADHSRRVIGNSSLLEWAGIDENFSSAKNEFTNLHNGITKRKKYVENRMADLLRGARFKYNNKKIDISPPSSLSQSLLPGYFESFTEGKIPMEISSLSNSQLQKSVIAIENADKENLNYESRKMLQRYKEYLEYQLEFKFLEIQDGLTRGLGEGKIEANWNLEIQETWDTIKSAEEKLKILENSNDNGTAEGIKEKKIKILEHKEYIQLLEDKLNFYKKYRNAHGVMNSTESAYELFFNNPNESKEKGGLLEGLRSPDRAVMHLIEFHEWIEGMLFDLAAPPMDPKVRALLVAACFRGELSPKKMQVILKNMNDAGNITSFYAAIRSFSSELELGNIPLLIKDKKFEEFFGQFKSVLGSQYSLFQKTTTQWGDFSRKGDSADSKILEKMGENADVGFENTYGFRIQDAYHVWQQSTGFNALPEQKGRLGLDINLGIAIPLSQFIKNDGSVNDSLAMKYMLAKIVSGVDFTQFPEALGKKKLYEKIVSKQWNSTDGDISELTTFVSMLQSRFEKSEKIEKRTNYVNTAYGSSNYLRNLNGGKISEHFESFLDEMGDGNMTYWGISAIILYAASKNKWIKNGLLVGAFAGFGNEFLSEEFGFEPLKEGWDLVMGNSKEQINNPANGTISDMRKRKTLDTEHYSEKELTIAGTVLGKCNLREVLDWYTKSTNRQNADLYMSTGHNKESQVFSQDMPAPLRNQLHFLLKGEQGEGMEEKRAKLVYHFFEQYLGHVDARQNNRIGGGDIKSGEAYLRNNFVDPPKGTKAYEDCQETYSENGVEKRGYRLEQVFRSLTSPETYKEMLEETPLIEFFKEHGQNAVTFVEVHMAEAFGSKENASKKMEEMLIDIKAWGWNVYSLTADEIMFRDTAGKAWRIVKNKTVEAANGAWSVVSENGAVQWVGKNIEGAWGWLKKQPKEAKYGMAYLNSLLAGADSVVLKEKVPFSGSDVNMIDAVGNLGILSSIRSVYGIDNIADTKRFIEEAQKDSTVQQELRDIASARNGNSSGEITHQDISLYFFGWAGYGSGALVQGSVNIIEMVSRLANGVLQWGVGVVSDDAKAFLMEYDPSKLARVFPRDNISGNAGFRDFVEKTSRESFSSSSSEVLSTQDAFKRYINKRLQELETDPLKQSDWFKSIFQKFYNDSIAGINPWLRRNINPNVTIKRWENISDYKKKHVIAFVTNEFKKDMMSSSFRNDLLEASRKNSRTGVTPTGKIPVGSLDVITKDQIHKYLSQYDWAIT